MCASGRSDVGEGVWGGMNSTDLAPKMVLPAMCTVALEGMKRIWSLLMASISRAWSPL
jgi:ABC-type arginine transport system permease subunit